MARNVDMSGYPYLIPVVNGLVLDGKSETGVPTTAVFVPKKDTALWYM